ncbi:MAG: ABC transporter ATP-binding protein [Spirochaeta sp.]|jgi:ABC-type nitrate/sulfonate/bicarbonate transport system ATPase subunit|nr:ABC transporter ATP-binding protein [Spirochaeta sp.]
MRTIELRRVSREFRSADATVAAVSDVSVAVQPGSFTTIVGLSGCGKTTLLRLMAGLIEPTSGILHSDEGPIGIMRHTAALVFQDARLLPWLNVETNLLLALRRERLPRNEARERVSSALSSVGMFSWRSAYPRALSGGMAQRINLARALCRRQKLWLLDEPFSALDAINRRALQTELLRLWSETSPTVVLVTHDVPEAVLLSDRILTMSDGRIISDRSVGLPRPRTPTDHAFGEMVAETFATLG